MKICARPTLCLLLGLLFFVQAAVAQNDSGLAWGISAMTLKPACLGAPSLAELLTNSANTVSLDRFYRAGGVGLAPMPTDCRITYDSDGLLVVFRCTEHDLSFPAINRNANWYSLLGSASEQDSSFPDKVDLFIRPELNKSYYYQFAVALDGSKFGCRRRLRSAAEPDDENEKALASARLTKVTDFDASVSTETNAWTVLLRIPWSTIGGKPQDGFGLLPVRTRWRDGEVCSPVAFDFTERPPMDLFVETHFSGEPAIRVCNGNLCRLPSGVWRWQRPALLSYPDTATVHEIWQMQQSLSEPTAADNFARRLYLTQRWTDLLTLEGFNFRMERGSIVETNLTPYSVRREVNADLQTNNATAAYHSLDVYLHALDKVSREWFADGSPGDIGQWEPVTKVESLETNGNVLLLHCLAGGHSVALHISLPKTGGVRIYGDDEGYFKPDSLLPLNLARTPNYWAIVTADSKVIIGQYSFGVTFCDATGNPVTRIGPNDLAFRFDANGKIAAVDFRNSLDTNEVIFGFGERYDSFNENGNVLTLWGMDDWIGNTVGLMNQTYKPIALFHSSKGYTIFDNSTYRLRADIGKTNPHQYRLTQPGPIFDYYVWTTTPECAISSYTSLTGKPILPPVWAFEPWMGRTGRGWNAPSHDAVAEEESVTKRFADLDIPHSAIYSEGPGAESPELNRFMAARGIKVLSWFWPVVSKKEQAKLLPEIPTNELPLLNVGNEKASDELGYVDFTNPNALELMQQWWKLRLDLGVAGSMVDFGDRVPPEAVFYNGKRGDEMHNFYAYDYHRTINEIFSEKRGDDFILFGRAAAPGTQHWVAQFAGDHPSNFAGLQSVYTGALNLCACGFSTWGSDLGGFLGWPEPAVYMRWVEFGCFSPLMRCHGRTPREPWDYGDAAVANYKYFTWVRENLLDYIYNAAADARETGVPIMRSMAFAFPDDPATANASGEYMFGRDLLVAPVLTEDSHKSIYFPRDKWTSLWTGETISGPTNFIMDVPLNTIPVYLKPGAIVPARLNHMQFGQSLTPDNEKSLIVTPPDKPESATFDFEVSTNWPRQAIKISASVTLQPETNGFIVALNHFKARYLLAYDVQTVSAVKVNGADVHEMAPDDFSYVPVWRLDTDQDRLIIRPPLMTNSQPMKIEIKF